MLLTYPGQKQAFVNPDVGYLKRQPTLNELYYHLRTTK